MGDTEIIDLYWARNESALSESQKAYGHYCHSIAWNVLHDTEDSDECVNDTWLRAWNSIPPNRPAKLGLFLGTITRNLALDRWKGQRTLKRGNGEMTVVLDEIAECVSDKKTTEDIVEAKELKNAINRFLRTIPERDCNIFLRRYWYMEEYAEIAKRYSLNLNTIKSSLFRTRNKLKDYLQEEGFVV
ncbi:MAG: sigma-70 family RNA polymerase sigma factor [Acetatifactor sp.]|nr:sigma-70 family RNA polymerase sigma factor [Acetatifactor sp.]